MHDGNKALWAKASARIWLSALQRDEMVLEEVKAPNAKLNLSSR